jgi:hypothetical protein
VTKSSGIETGLLRMQSEILLAFRSSRQKIAENRGQGSCSPIGEMDPASCREILTGNGAQDCIACGEPVAGHSLSYLRLANLDNGLIDRLARYEGSLWRQAVQTLFALQALKRR